MYADNKSKQIPQYWETVGKSATKHKDAFAVTKSCTWLWTTTLTQNYHALCGLIVNFSYGVFDFTPSDVERVLVLVASSLPSCGVYDSTHRSATETISSAIIFSTVVIKHVSRSPLGSDNQQVDVPSSEPFSFNRHLSSVSNPTIPSFDKQLLDFRSSALGN